MCLISHAVTLRRGRGECELNSECGFGNSIEKLLYKLHPKCTSLLMLRARVQAVLLQNGIEGIAFPKVSTSDFLSASRIWWKERSNRKMPHVQRKRNAGSCSADWTWHGTANSNYVLRMQRPR